MKSCVCLFKAFIKCTEECDVMHACRSTTVFVKHVDGAFNVNLIYIAPLNTTKVDRCAVQQDKDTSLAHFKTLSASECGYFFCSA